MAQQISQRQKKQLLEQAENYFIAGRDALV